MHQRDSRPRSGQIAWTLAIAAVSALLGAGVDLAAPGLDRYMRDWLMRSRGPLPAPDDIAIVAIDEASIARYGRFPWPRSLTGRAIELLTAAQPRVIAVNVLYSDPTQESEDTALARAMSRAGMVITAAQLEDDPAAPGRARWLLPIPAIAKAAAAVGHVNVSTEAEGVARQLLIGSADDSGRFLRAMAVEAVRIGDGTAQQSVTESEAALVLGNRVIRTERSGQELALSKGGAVQVLRANRMTIDYIGPAGSFARHTYSLADVIEGRIPAEQIRGKYVLIGATAASLGDRLASPFVHHEDVHANQHGALMPGVEVLANAVNTILRARYYTETPEWLSLLISALMAVITMGSLAAAQGGWEGVRQIAVLGGVAGSLLFGGRFVFTQFLVFPPLTSGLVSFAAAGLLGLVRRSLLASVHLDECITEVASASGQLVPASGASLEDGGTVRRWRLPRGIEWKARTLGRLNARILARAQFVDSALQAVEDGLIIAAADGRIQFANRRAAAILSSQPAALAGRDLFESLAGTGSALQPAREEDLRRLIEDRATVEREISIRQRPVRHYILRMAAVWNVDAGSAEALGIVASLSEVTRLHELQQTKNDVMALVSHEMRTPLTAIQGMSELLAQYDVDAVRSRELHLAINDEARRLTAMITEYLDITRLESGATPLRREALRLEVPIERVLAMLEPLAAKQQIRLKRRFDPQAPGILADSALLGRAVENLVSNAIKYSPPGTDVTISTAWTANEVSIEVADEGRGIPPSDRERVFEKFYRVPRVEDAGIPGTGLGLALVREIAERHGGTVGVKSTMGAGSVFTIRIPGG